MSTVDKMLIKGIRSFDPANTTVITFFRPLTLIVGPNGAGKTTIIECLKNACTGELPPNSRSGQTFIHDPKVAGETETKGQIKLRFKTGAGKDVVCIRSFQLTQKASKMEYKAIESVLQTINSQTGEKVSLSYRCADMDREVPTLMGVSKAVLENVIFVHQDEANWPLAEPAVLKKKFDDIFSATRYTKALETIKKLHKEQAQDIKMYKLKLENLQIVKDAAYKLQESIDSDKEKAARMHSQNRDLEKKIGEIRSRISSIEKSLKDLRSLQSQITTKRAMKDMLTQRRVKQYDELAEENEDPDEDLATWQSRFQDNIGQLRSSIEKLEREMDTSSIEIESHRETFTNTCKVQGRLQAEKEAFLRIKRDHDVHIQRFFAEMNLGDVNNLPLSTEMALRYVTRAVERLDELKADFQELQEANIKTVDRLQDAVQLEVRKKIEVDSNIKATKEQQKKDQKRHETVSEEVEILSMEVKEHEIRRADEAERLLAEEVTKATARLQERGFDSKIRDGKDLHGKLEGRRKTLQRLKDDLASEFSERTELRIRKENLADKELCLNKILPDVVEKYKKAVRGRVPDTKNLKREVEEAYSAKKAEVGVLLEKSKEADQEVIKVSSKLDEAKRLLEKYKKDGEIKRKHLMSKLTSIVDIKSFNTHLKEAIEYKNEKQRRRDELKGERNLYEPFEVAARREHVCPCCERPFSPAEEDDFVRKQRVKISTFADRLRNLSGEFSDADQKLLQLERLRPVYEEYSKLNQELIPSEERSVEDLSKERENLTEAQVDSPRKENDYRAKRESIFLAQSCLLGEANGQLEMIESLLVPSNNVDRLHKEIQVLRRQIEEQEISLDAHSHSDYTLEEITKDLAAVMDQLEESRRNLDKLMEEQLQAKDDVTVINNRWQRAKEKRFEIATKLETLSQKKQDLELLKEQVSSADRAVTALESDREPLSRRIQALEQELQACKRKVAAEEQDRLKNLRTLEKEVDTLRSSSNTIKKYLDSGTEAKLTDIVAKLSNIKAEQKACESNRDELSVELTKNRELLSNQAQVKRNIDDNISYRQTLNAERQVGEEISTLEREMSQIGDLRTIEADLKRMAAEEQALLSELNRSQGTVAVFESNMNKNKMELKLDKYKEIDNRYCNQLLQLKTTEMANKDLDKYYNALDKALMRFHAMKMEEINKIIKELWQQTYRGQDIDYIEIRSDAEGVGTRSYSYRVVMRSGDAELEMRGRCSAGQKVLASLIIRLALAETFCLNCGILALDEPTTNLDTPNAESLASALLRIIEDRKGQENFQLIVITHDERFAQLIGQRQHAERYYRITKDDHQHSRIDVQDIFD